MRPDDNEVHDSDYLVDKLFDFYLKVSPQLRSVSSFILYWAFKRHILSPKYLAESAWKMLILVFMVSLIDNKTNIIHVYREDYSGQV